MHFQPIEVHTYSGYRGNERPVGFWLEDQYQEVDHILDRWYEGSLIAGRPVIQYFKVHTKAGQEYLLRHTPPHNRWEIQIPVAPNGDR